MADVWSPPVARQPNLEGVRRFFICNEVMTRNDKGGHPSEQRLQPIWPRFLKLYTVDVGENVDSQGRQTNVKDRFFPT